MKDIYYEKLWSKRNKAILILSMERMEENGIINHRVKQFQAQFMTPLAKELHYSEYTLKSIFLPTKR